MKISNCSYDYDLYAKSKFYLKLNKLINYNFFYDLVANPNLNKLHGCALCRENNIDFGEIKKTNYLIIFSCRESSFNYCYEFCSKKHLEFYIKTNESFNLKDNKIIIFDRSNFFKIEEMIFKIELLK